MILIFNRLSKTLAAALCCASIAMAQGGESLQGLVNIRFQNDIRLFTVMAALNVAGFDEESSGQEMSDVRRAVREQLADLDPDLRRRLQEFYQSQLDQDAIHEQPQAAFTSLALLLSGPPDFQLTADEENTPADAQRVRGFQAFLSEFYREADVANLWEKYRPAYERELLSYQPVLRDVLQQTLNFFRVPARVVLDREIVLIPDLLDKKNIVNARNLERVYYIVVGPSDSPLNNRSQLQHEYLHFLVDPLVRKFGASLMSHQNLLDLAQRQPRIRSEYQNRYLLMATESLIEALQLAMSGADSQARDRALVDLFRQGLILAPYFYRGLEAYAHSEMVSLPTFMEPLLDGVDPERVRRDEKEIAELESSLRAEDEARNASLEESRREAERRQAAQTLFREATERLQRQELEAAEEKLHALLEREPDHGGAWFYLAQISFQRGEYASALEAYRKSSVASDSPIWVRAWSLVRMGRILAAQGAIEDARRLFLEAQTLEGDLQGAREMAAESLAALDSRP